MAEDFGPSAVSENNQERNSSANGCNFIFPQIQARPAVYHHVKKLMFTVRVDEPDPRFGNMLLEQFGGANGELAAAMQYSIQGLNCEDPDRKDLLMDIGTEELRACSGTIAANGGLRSD